MFCCDRWWQMAIKCHEFVHNRSRTIFTMEVTNLCPVMHQREQMHVFFFDGIRCLRSSQKVLQICIETKSTQHIEAQHQRNPARRTKNVNAHSNVCWIGAVNLVKWGHLLFGTRIRKLDSSTVSLVGHNNEEHGLVYWWSSLLNTEHLTLVSRYVYTYI